MCTKVLIPAPKIQLLFQSKIKMSERPIIRCSDDGVALLRQHWDEHTYELREQAWLMLLSAGCRVLGCFQLSVGGVSTVIIDPAIVFMIALRTPGVRSLILAHNHPGGTTTPSTQDERITKKVKVGAQMFGMTLTDHYIITTDTYLSMADEGML